MNQFRDFIHVDDVAEAVVILLKKEQVGIYNIASGKKTKFYELINLFSKLLKRKIKFKNTVSKVSNSSYANIYKIKNKLKIYHDHNGEKVRPRIIEKILRGKRIALVSDAGTPLISDPGYKLVVEARDKKIYVTTCPGATAPIAALSISAMPTDRFFFLGFLPLKEMNRAKILEEVKNIHSTLVFFEAPKRLEKTLEELFLFLGNRPVSICREISKKFEEIIIMMSCRNAIKVNMSLNLAQIRNLISDLEETEMPYTCPHGRPIALLYEMDSILKKFLRK